jgi:hypothetical protein
MSLKVFDIKVSASILVFLISCFSSQAQSHIKLEKNGRSILLYKGQRFNYINLKDQNQRIQRGRLFELRKDSMLIFSNDTVYFNDFVFANRNKLLSAEIYKKPFALGFIGAGLITSSFAYGIEGLNYGDNPQHYKRNMEELFRDYNHTIIYAATTSAFWSYIYLRNRNGSTKLREDWDYQLNYASESV